jgi:hypothetical protein
MRTIGRDHSRLFGFLLWAAACSPTAAPSAPSLVQAPELSASRRGDDDFPLYGLGSRHDHHDCDERGFRAFDFWLGNWNVYGQDGQLGGTNSVTREVEGCAIEEHWTDAAGGRGRSINTFDAGTGKWNQLWMDASGLAIYLEGESAPGQMSMSGDTPKFINGPIITNRITWSRLAANRVRQYWEISEDGRMTWTPAFDGDYRREHEFHPATEVPNAVACEPAGRVRYHWFDFIVGSWDLREAGDRGRELGRLEVTKDLSGCLLEWRFRGREGYSGKAFAAFHFPSLQWHRTWIDEDGVRLGLKGQLEGTSMVFTGSRAVKHGRTQLVRATWEPVDANQVTERWETSDDDGTTWERALEVVLSRR